MLLAELSGYKAAKHLSFEQVVHNIIASGKYKKYKGGYAFVLEPIGKDFVYRVWTEDTGYDEFLKYAAAHQSKHIVKLIGSTRSLPLVFKHDDVPYDKMSVQRIEKLKPITSQLAIEVISLCNHFLKRKAKTATFDAMVHGAMNSTLDHEELVQEFMLDHKAFFLVYLDIAKWASAKNPQLIDMHAKNVMQRSNGDLVVTDPFAGVFNRYALTDIADSK